MCYYLNVHFQGQRVNVSSLVWGHQRITNVIYSNYIKFSCKSPMPVPDQTLQNSVMTSARLTSLSTIKKETNQDILQEFKTENTTSFLDKATCMAINAYGQIETREGFYVISTKPPPQKKGKQDVQLKKYFSVVILRRKRANRHKSLKA